MKETIFAVTQAVIAIVIIAGTIYSAINNLAATPYMTGLSGIVIGYFFGKTNAIGIAAGKIFK